jgi:membrane protein YdbS with pleckstrin-like domain
MDQNEIKKKKVKLILPFFIGFDTVVAAILIYEYAELKSPWPTVLMIAAILGAILMLFAANKLWKFKKSLSEKGQNGSSDNQQRYTRN